MKFNKKITKLKLLKKFVPLAIGVSISSSAFADDSFVSNAKLPVDINPTCTAEVAPWFNGNITANGWVNPANSLDNIFGDFDNNTRCDFYKWGAQMFLWLTSGNESQHVFNTAPTFYNVSIADENGNRTYIAEDGPMMLGVRKSKTNEEIELGQAGGLDALISQDGSIVYYSLHANDVFALFSTGQEQGAFGSSLPDFPNTKKDLSKVITFARQWGYSIESPEALAMELKASWVDAETLSAAEKKSHILTTAVVPVFDRSNETNSKGVQQWTITGNKVKTLALVGMHIVGTVKDHPEMIWSTIEHVSNVPDNDYFYTNTSDKTGSVTYDSSGSWIFSESGIQKPSSITASAVVSTYTPTPDVSDPQCVGDKPIANECLVSTSKTSGGGKIQPINILRVDPWGNNQNNSDKAKQSASIANSTDLVSINKSVLSQLKNGDLRGNYIQTGGVWTATGTLPPNGTDDSLRGSLNLANTTMETFFQFQNSYFNPENCFGCHSYDPANQKPTDISHIFSAMEPLPSKLPADDAKIKNY